MAARRTLRMVWSSSMSHTRLCMSALSHLVEVRAVVARNLLSAAWAFESLGPRRAPRNQVSSVASTQYSRRRRCHRRSLRRAWHLKMWGGLHCSHPCHREFRHHLNRLLLHHVHRHLDCHLLRLRRSHCHQSCLRALACLLLLHRLRRCIWMTHTGSAADSQHTHVTGLPRMIQDARSTTAVMGTV